MAGGVIERRRIVLTGERARVDLALPLGDPLADVLASARLVETVLGPSAGSAAGQIPTRFVVLDPLGYEVDAATAGEDLVEGGLYTLVDLSAPVTAPERKRSRAEGSDRADHGSRWLLLAVTALLLLAAVAGTTPAEPWIRLAIAVIAAAGAVITAAVWARGAGSAGVLALRGALAPAALSFAAGALMIPGSLEAATQLSVATGLLAAAVTAALIALLTPTRRIRAAAGTVAILLVAFGAVWGFTLLVHWGAADAAAICLGLVPLLVKALPSALVNLPEGAFIDYEHFMSSRWTVRGTIPEPVTEVRVQSVRDVVDDSSARLAAGTVLLGVAAAVFAPFAVQRPWGEDPFVLSGGIALLVCTVLALLLIPRHTTSRLLRWVPRAAAVVVLVVAVAGLTAGAVQGAALIPWVRTLGADGMLLAAAGLFVAAVIAVAVTRPVSRGASSLVLSRVADVVEGLAVALALPAALLYADVLTLLRGMMAA
ncbi:hypothetical protein [Microbacterium panaciterrae]|uniref:hypothetical protein n=1 Tax=Microbacterium panaciterrae TaxID=985759 RepID=UPI0031E895DC